jgi:hypothetical protein
VPVTPAQILEGVVTLFKLIVLSKDPKAALARAERAVLADAADLATDKALGL